MSESKRDPNYIYREISVEDVEIMPPQDINRWRAWTIEKYDSGISRPYHSKAEAINAVFDLALLGSARAFEIEKEVNKRLRSKLRELAKAIPATRRK